MAIQGIFLADFSQYNAAVDGADAKLRKFTASTTSHETASRQFNSTTDRGANSFGQLSQGLATADKTLAAFGVHIGPEIHALEELSQASGKTASELGTIGTISLAAAAGLGAFKLTSLILDFTGLDKAIGNVVDSWLQLDAAQISGAKQDSINRAIKDGAAATITYGEAVKFNIKHANDAAVAIKEHAEAQKEQEKAAKAAAKATEDEVEALKRLQKAHDDAIHAGADKLFGNDAIKAAEDYVEKLGRVENAAVLSSEALQEIFDGLTAGISAMTLQNRTAEDLTNTFEKFRIAVVQAQQSHTQAVVQMETDEERFKRENDELAKAMHDNFVVIGQSAQEAAQKVSMSFSQAMDAVRAGQGTLSGSFQSIAPGTPGSTTRYDDYGNPYGYIPGVNQPGRISPTGSGSSSIFIDARESFFDSQAGAQRLADKVVTALGTRVASQGGR